MSLVETCLSKLGLRHSGPPFSLHAPSVQRTADMFIHLRQPMPMPGTVLPPGNYVFRRVRQGRNADVVQVLNEDQSKLLATVHDPPQQPG